MLNSLKFRLIEWLGIATKDEVQDAHDHAVHFVLSKVPDTVKEELDRDERTVVVNIGVTTPLDTDAIKVAVAKALANL